MEGQSFNSKILLFGEYAIVKGGQGLAIPFKKYAGKLSIGNQDDERFKKLYSYLKNSPLLCEKLHLDQMNKDLEQGMSFDSNIPQGYGVGSSGALCASIYARYSKDFSRQVCYNSQELKLLQDYMALMESFYHGSSSGLDCLISLVDCPVHIKGRKDAEVVDCPQLHELGHFYLLDSKMERKTSPLVHNFLARLDSESDYKKEFQEFLDINNQTIKAFLKNDQEKFKNTLLNLSHKQLSLFEDMIPAEVKDFWQAGLTNSNYITKLCGAGGGGFFLVYSIDKLNIGDLIEL